MPEECAGMPWKFMDEMNVPQLPRKCQCHGYVYYIKVVHCQRGPVRSTENKKFIPDSKQQQRKIPSVPYNRTFYVPKWNSAKKVNSAQQTDIINPECKSETSYYTRMDKNKIAVLEDQLLKQNRELILAYKKIQDKDNEIDSLHSQHGIITPEDLSVTNMQTGNHSVLMQRIFVLEEIVARQSKELTDLYKDVKEKQKEIVFLRNQLRVASSSCGACGNNVTNTNLTDLPEDYLELQKKATEMETFLNNYGMTWVGESSDMYSGEYCKPDFDHILRMIHILNIENREPQLHYTNHGATFKTCAVYHLSLHANGMLTEDKLFREYSDISAQRFIQDIADGYLPSELQQRYPAGVILHVEDNRNNEYTGCEEKNCVFRGQGIKLSDIRLKPKIQEQTFNILNENIRTSLSEKYKDYSTSMQGTWNPSESQAYRYLSECEPTRMISTDSLTKQCSQAKQNFIKCEQKPKQIIKDGVIVNTLKNEKTFEKEANINLCSADCPEGYIKVKIRSLEGKTILVYVQPKQSVSELKKSLGQLMSGYQLLHLKGKSYICLDDDQRSLLSYGINKNTMLLSRTISMK